MLLCFALLILILEFGFVAEVLPGNVGGQKRTASFVVTLMRGPSPRTLLSAGLLRTRAGGELDQAVEA